MSILLFDIGWQTALFMLLFSSHTHHLAWWTPLLTTHLFHYFLRVLIDSGLYILGRLYFLSLASSLVNNRVLKFCLPFLRDLDLILSALWWGWTSRGGVLAAAESPTRKDLILNGSDGCSFSSCRTSQWFWMPAPMPPQTILLRGWPWRKYAAYSAHTRCA